MVLQDGNQELEPIPSQILSLNLTEVEDVGDQLEKVLQRRLVILHLDREEDLPALLDEVGDGDHQRVENVVGLALLAGVEEELDDVGEELPKVARDLVGVGS